MGRGKEENRGEEKRRMKGGKYIFEDGKINGQGGRRRTEKEKQGNIWITKTP